MSRNMEPLPFDPLFNRPLLSELLLDRLIPPPDQARSAGSVTQERLIRYVLLMISIIAAATESFLETALPKEPEPYHTSALKGEEWLMELIVGHPQRIRCELGVHAHVFEKLIMELRGLGHGRSRYVSLEEQLAIFLYTCVTGLTIRHVGERFQRSSDTISK